MATVTPNFNWPVPTSTDLVKDGATAIEALGDSIDASLVDLKGGTTGQVLSKNSNTDMDFTWVTNADGDITGVSVTSPLTGGGTSGSVTVGILSGTTSNLGAVQLSDSTSSTSTTLAATANAVKTSYDLANAAIPKSTVTTAGDVIYATGSGTVTRLGIGTAGQVLTVNGGATAPSWTTASSGGMTQIATGTLSGSTATLGSIAGTYKSLRLVLDNVQVNAIVGLRFKVNNNSSAIYDGLSVEGRSGAIREAYYTGENQIEWTYYRPVTGNNGNVYILDFPNYASSTAFKMVSVLGEGNCADGSGTGSGLPVINDSQFAVRTLTAISEINLSLSSSTFAGGTYTLWGVS